MNKIKEYSGYIGTALAVPFIVISFMATTVVVGFIVGYKLAWEVL